MRCGVLGVKPPAATHGCDTATCHVCNDGAHGVPGNSSGPSASGKIPEAFKASFVVTEQPVTDPHWALHQNVGSIIHGHVAHASHAYRNHSGPNLESFYTPFRVPPVLCRSCIRKMRSDLQTFRLITRELWRVAILHISPSDHASGFPAVVAVIFATYMLWNGVGYYEYPARSRARIKHRGLITAKLLGVVGFVTGLYYAGVFEIIASEVLVPAHDLAVIAFILLVLAYMVNKWKLTKGRRR